MTIDQTYGNCQKLQNFISEICILAVCFQELRNGECVTHAHASGKDNFLLHQNVILHCYVKSRLTQVTLSYLSKKFFWLFLSSCSCVWCWVHSSAGWHHDLDLACPHPHRSAWCLALRLTLTFPPSCHGSWLGVAGWVLAEVLPYNSWGYSHVS